jgi:hypothetical protein
LLAADVDADADAEESDFVALESPLFDESDDEDEEEDLSFDSFCSRARLRVP